jgi:hypothetical protein
MSLVIKYPLELMSVYLWIGFVGAISFMEAWLKFRAPGVTLPIGLGIGRLVFNALNKAEWVFAFAIIISALLYKQDLFSFNGITFFIPLFLLVMQTLWLLPALDARAQMHINGESLEPSKLHIYYVTAEVVKVISLFVFSFKLIR